MNMNKNNFSEIEARLKRRGYFETELFRKSNLPKFKSKITIKLASIFCIFVFKI